MLPKDKHMNALIKKIQKKCDTHVVKRKDTPKDEIEVEDTSSEIFNEMKRLPYTS